MGGFGSGPGSGRVTTGSALALDFARLRKAGGIGGTYGWSLAGQQRGSVEWHLGTEALVLIYHRAGERITQRLPVARTAMHFGGEREWLRCVCGRCCRVVYLGQQGFRCRRCYRLVYQSQREHAGTRSLRRQNAVLHRLGAEPGDSFPDKPPRMHWRTYLRLAEQYETADCPADNWL